MVQVIKRKKLLSQILILPKPKMPKKIEKIEWKLNNIFQDV